MLTHLPPQARTQPRESGQPPSGALSLLRSVQRFDDRRAGLPGEHWATFGVAVALLRKAGSSRSRGVKLAAGAAGAALVWRSLSGRDGLLRMITRR